MGTPADVIARINKGLNVALNDAEIGALLAAQGAEPSPGTPQELARFIQEDTARWAKLVKERNLKLD